MIISCCSSHRGGVFISELFKSQAVCCLAKAQALSFALNVTGSSVENHGPDLFFNLNF